ncbi:AraC-like ligand-binding domain-containing protein [Mycobacterium montefiorense]|uniref:Transcriptional regulator n=1 Tax=Mycobacterium montefiorense TaxID=154654 RepID=A0AA37US79_9MYCO|nr:helix-turn-helix domain-containing protein [Mycobacterium montefiorense]GBG38292.1 transcriptional regulator [Mycobacterium montefiorense]GKU36184.1 transcriptional regulator [Mycobacterium montefiorense]GKU38739.1 transcriptional regulator [Mycobacterium montefiorense]GKU48255.1 transcriptional regulator [Mycobacterium montefiorense]GKU53928.1 transcriptional regulator [Mycobacterium montefiorense]
MSTGYAGSLGAHEGLAMLCTNGRTGAKRFDAFCQAVSANYLPVAMSMDDVKAFNGVLRPATLGAVQLGRVLVANDVTVRRTEKLIDRGAPDYVKVGVQLAGSCLVSQGDREAVLKSGDYVVYDTARPYELITRGPFHMQTVQFRRNLLRLPGPQLSQLTAQPINGHAGLGQMVSSFVVELGKSSTGEFGSSTAYLADAVVDMFAASFVEQLTDSTEWSICADRKSLLLRVRAFIEGNLDESGLNISTIAAAHNISVRYLQKLFEQEGQTVSGWIRDRRIDHCRKDLTNPALADLSVHSIAANWGLDNASHFSRLFRAKFGEAPRDYRKRMSENPKAEDRGVSTLLPEAITQ